jgi:asparagine synthase (glutamine-hydrolysing)
MCGIAGIWNYQATTSAASVGDNLRRMTNALIHRGPDREGFWSESESGIAFGFRRLAILELSAAGNQPMQSGCGRYVMVFNGEIYNFLGLKSSLIAEGYSSSFKGNSDSEVLLASISHWGLHAALRKTNGMFALAVWDRENRTLSLARDRLGEKPLYFSTGAGGVLFASELSALSQHGSFRKELDRDALALFFRLNYIPAPHTIFRGAFKLPPATISTFTRDGERSDTLYWNAADLLHSKRLRDGDETQILQATEELLKDSVRLRCQADVPLGAFLSGGIDSSLVVALMQEISSTPIKTFSLGFTEERFNEAPAAKKVAAHLGTIHTEMYVRPEEVMRVVTQLGSTFDEPFSDSSQIPTFLVSQLARRDVTVCLSGDGGDELFAGYNRYTWGPRIWNWLQRIPQRVRAHMADALEFIGPRTLMASYAGFQPLMPVSYRVADFPNKLSKLTTLLRMRDAPEWYMRAVSTWTQPDLLVHDAQESRTLLTDLPAWPPTSDLTSLMMYLDLVGYLPGDILTKVDRTTMGVSLEARVPLLDHRLVEFAWTLPSSFKVRNGKGKWILRQLLSKYLPPNLVERPKMGFAMPLDVWLRSDLKEWAQDLLSQGRRKHRDLLNFEEIDRKWDEHQVGTRNWQDSIWSVLMFESWSASQ